MHLNDFIIRHAKAEEVDLFIDILEETAEWLKAKGIKQWPPGMFRTAKSRAELLDAIAAKRCYLIDYYPSGKDSNRCNNGSSNHDNHNHNHNHKNNNYNNSNNNSNNNNNNNNNNGDHRDDDDGNGVCVIQGISTTTTWTDPTSQNAGLFVLNYEDDFDKDLWEGYVEDWKDAIYLHRLVLKKPFRGIGLTAKIIVFTEQKVKEAGRHYLRLDTLAANTGLRRFYRERCRGKEEDDDEEEEEEKEGGGGGRGGGRGLKELETVWNPTWGLEFARFEML
ncbi:hypothetical protein BX616_005505, partial [Lobosporangium transversale]